MTPVYVRVEVNNNNNKEQTKYTQSQTTTESVQLPSELHVTTLLYSPSSVHVYESQWNNIDELYATLPAYGCQDTSEAPEYSG